MKSRVSYNISLLLRTKSHPGSPSASFPSLSFPWRSHLSKLSFHTLQKCSRSTEEEPQEQLQLDTQALKGSSSLHFLIFHARFLILGSWSLQGSVSRTINTPSENIPITWRWQCMLLCSIKHLGTRHWYIFQIQNVHLSNNLVNSSVQIGCTWVQKCSFPCSLARNDSSHYRQWFLLFLRKSSEALTNSLSSNRVLQGEEWSVMTLHGLEE